MKRFGTLNLALILMLLLPVSAWAQRDTDQTREGDKLITLAMTRQTMEEKAELYRDALTHLRQGMEEDADNARVWLLAGKALAGLGEMAEADQAFDRAVQLHPEYEEEIDAERLDAWLVWLQLGLESMDEENFDAAIQQIEAAETILEGRPEGQMYLGVLYANHEEDYVKAEAAFRRSLEATRSPLFEEQDEETQQDWLAMQPSLIENLEQMAMTAAISHFQEQRYEEAATRFLELAENNPHSRDIWFNLAQATLAQVNATLETLEAMEEAETSSQAAEDRQKLLRLTEQLEEYASKSMEYDPNSELLYILVANSHRLRSQYGDSAQASTHQQAALTALQTAEAMPVALDEIALAGSGEGSVQITGLLKNRKLEAGTPVQVRFTLLNREGATVAQETITIQAPEVDTQVQFEGSIPADEDVTGWKYEVLN